MARQSPAQRDITAVDLRVSTAYAVRGSTTVLVDTGPAGAADRLLFGHGRGASAHAVQRMLSAPPWARGQYPRSDSNRHL
ncbi:hypothetical protein ACFQZU_11605 [Streptomonospora algeriensis]|uniref:Uncharacterized protein n=1 Tax=Streptomonospora algeriensis TaxID=995084 RepID=A0ABW3BFY0_9ACTN